MLIDRDLSRIAFLSLFLDIHFYASYAFYCNDHVPDLPAYRERCGSCRRSQLEPETQVNSYPSMPYLSVALSRLTLDYAIQFMLIYTKYKTAADTWRVFNGE